MQNPLFNLPLPTVGQSNGTQGSSAARSGRAVELGICGFLHTLGVQADHQRRTDWIGLKDNRITIDVFIHTHPAYPDGLAIESRWQDTPGSVDEKLLFKAMEIERRFKCPTIFVVAGGGARIPIVDQVKLLVDQDAPATQWGLRYVMSSIDELFAWCMKNL